MSNLLDAKGKEVAAELDEPFKSVALKCFELVKTHFENDASVEVILRDGWRSPPDQRRLFERGRKMGPKGWLVVGKILTYAQPGYSAHNYRRAVHIILINAANKKRPWLGDKDDRWHVIGQKAVECGLKWLGKEPTLRDMAHIESPNWRELAKTRKFEGLAYDERIYE